MDNSVAKPFSFLYICVIHLYVIYCQTNYLVYKILFKFYYIWCLSCKNVFITHCFYLSRDCCHTCSYNWWTLISPKAHGVWKANDFIYEECIGMKSLKIWPYIKGLQTFFLHFFHMQPRNKFDSEHGICSLKLKCGSLFFMLHFICIFTVIIIDWNLTWTVNGNWRANTKALV